MPSSVRLSVGIGSERLVAMGISLRLRSQRHLGVTFRGFAVPQPGNAFPSPESIAELSRPPLRFPSSYDKHRALPYTDKRLRGCPTDMGAEDNPMKNQRTPGLFSRRQEGRPLAIHKGRL